MSVQHFFYKYTKLKENKTLTITYTLTYTKYNVAKNQSCKILLNTRITLTNTNRLKDTELNLFKNKYFANNC